MAFTEPATEALIGGRAVSARLRLGGYRSDRLIRDMVECPCWQLREGPK